MKKIFLMITTFLLMISAFSNVYADVEDEAVSEELKDLTVIEAAQLAIDNSSAIKKSYETIDSTKKERLQQIEDHTSLYIPEEDEVTFLDNSSNLSSLLKIITLEITNQSNEIDVKLQKEKIEQSIRNLFLSIINAQRDIKLQKESIELSEKQLKISEKKLELGMMAGTDYLSEKLDYEKKLIALKEKESSISKTYISLNILMGTDVNANYNLVLDLDYKPMEEIDLESYIKEKQNSDPNIEKRNKDVTSAKYQLNIYTSTGNTSYETRKTNYNQALRAVEDAKSSLEETIRNLYSDIKNLELTMSSTAIDLEKTKEQLKVKEIQFNFGKATEIELLTLKNRIHELEQNIEKNKLDYAMNMLKFEKPYLAS